MALRPIVFYNASTSSSCSIPTASKRLTRLSHSASTWMEAGTRYAGAKSSLPIDRQARRLRSAGAYSHSSSRYWRSAHRYSNRFRRGIRGPGELEKRVDSGDWAVGFSMYPTNVNQLIDIADAGEIMPPKSTWFEPKLRSGLFVYTLDD